MRKRGAGEGFEPFGADGATLSIGGLGIENADGLVRIGGSLEVARDREGLRLARALRDAVGGLVAALEEGDLPERAERAVEPMAMAPNPLSTGEQR